MCVATLTFRNFYPRKIIHSKLNRDILRLLPNGCVKFLPLLSIDF